MSRSILDIGYVPLVDAAPLLVAQKMGFAEAEGLSLNLHKQPSWSALRDGVALGTLDAAQMLSPLPVAMSLGLGGLPTPMDALMVMSVNGNVIGVSNEIAAKMRAGGWQESFRDPLGTGNHLIRATGRRLRIGVPFPFSMHAELVFYWLGALGLKTPGELDVHTIPPPLMSDAIAADEIDAFCVGEPWGSIAVENGTGELVLPASAIWAFAPEKVLGARRDWIEEHPGETRSLMRAVVSAAQWLGAEENRLMASEVLAEPGLIDVPDGVLDRALSGHLITKPRALSLHTPRFLEFHASAANFPWRSQAAWIASNIASRVGLDRTEAMRTAMGCFRSDLYRANLADLGIDMPGASAKMEGALSEPTAVASAKGSIILGPDAFFDGTVFDPSPQG
ncbi:CmpA/NrtA family ABC transporter substrate-binding protein [Dinoroseobacter sp. S375]|uniref:CmpA/NrtA family ABC transporter substrate-binding protein n=1 Tax=Dinoroseobacter sp. S375 TaxID=3415136 RepID=UPI003C7E1904